VALGSGEGVLLITTIGTGVGEYDVVQLDNVNIPTTNKPMIKDLTIRVFIFKIPIWLA
jgi:hypothetical protein